MVSLACLPGRAQLEDDIEARQCKALMTAKVVLNESTLVRSEAVIKLYADMFIHCS